LAGRDDEAYRENTEKAQRSSKREKESKTKPMGAISISPTLLLPFLSMPSWSS
jgi:hypothetical protein